MTPSPTVAILSTGDMGSAVARTLVDHGAAVVTSVDGRSDRTRRLAEACGADVVAMDDAVGRADVVVSIVPPAEASVVAGTVAAAAVGAGVAPVYVDANAVSPATTHAIATTVAIAGMPFVDGSIIGPPPRRAGATRIYLSGPDAPAAAELGRFGLDVRVLSDRVGDASALKMTYAALSKGTAALMTQLAVAAHALGVDEHLRAELAVSAPDRLAAMERSIPALPVKSRRWVGEMLEISRTFAAVGLDPRLFEGAAATFDLVGSTSLADETPEDRDTDRTLGAAVEVIAAEALRRVEGAAAGERPADAG